MELISNAVQTVSTNQDILFTTVVIPGNCSMLHRVGSGLVTLRGLTQQCRARYRITFGANIAIPTGGTAGPASLAIAIDGEPIVSTTMISTPGDVEDFNNVSSSVFVDVPKNCCSQISVMNVGDQSISVEHANIIIERVA